MFAWRFVDLDYIFNHLFSTIELIMRESEVFFFLLELYVHI
jgi:hypothetical protein